MSTLLDNKEIQDYQTKFNAITVDTKANWGKMNAAQMFQHLNKSFEDVSSKQKVKRMFIGRIIGKKILKKVMQNKYLSKNSPTAPSFKAEGSPDFSSQKEKWQGNLQEFSNITESDLEGKVHPFFGKMTGKEWFNLINKHINHHLLQFITK